MVVWACIWILLTFCFTNANSRRIFIWEVPIITFSKLQVFAQGKPWGRLDNVGSQHYRYCETLHVHEFKGLSGKTQVYDKRTANPSPHTLLCIRYLVRGLESKRKGKSMSVFKKVPVTIIHIKSHP